MSADRDPGSLVDSLYWRVGLAFVAFVVALLLLQSAIFYPVLADGTAVGAGGGAVPDGVRRLAQRMALRVANKLATSQLALPKTACDEVYATTGYEQSVRNLSQISLASDMIFADSASLELATTMGSVSGGYTATHRGGLDTDRGSLGAMTAVTLTVVGRVDSSLRALSDAPRQGDEGAPDATILIEPAFAPALAGLRPGDEIVLLTWLDRADRRTLAVHPRDDASAPLTGVFATRSPDRPNPIGLHRVTVRTIDGARLRVGPLEAIDGTPIVDLKIVWKDS